MAEHLKSAFLVGSSGLVGSHILKTLTLLKSQTTITAIARKELPTVNHSSFTSVLEPDSSKWSSIIETTSTPHTALFSALGTSRAKAGSLEAQRKIDHDLNLDLARAAKHAGIQIYVLISVAATSTLFPYSKMKLELEQAVIDLGIPYTIIVRPGLLVGTREENRPAEAAARFVATKLGSVSNRLKDFWAQDVDVVAKAAVSAAQQCAVGRKGTGVWKLEQADIVRLGRTEWKDER